MSQLPDPFAIPRIIQHGADSLLDIAALQERQRQNEISNQLAQQEEQRRQSQFQLFQDAQQRQLAQDQAAQQYHATQYAQLNPEPQAQGDEGDFFMPSHEEYAAQQQNFRLIDPREQQRELLRMQEEQRDNQTWSWARRAGVRAADLSPAHRDRYMAWAQRNGIDPATNELVPTPDPQDAIDSQYMAFQMGDQYGPSVNPAMVSPSILARERGYQNQGMMADRRFDQQNANREDQQQYGMGLEGIRQDNRLAVAAIRSNRQPRPRTAQFTPESLVKQFPNLAADAQFYVDSYNGRDLSFNDLQQENTRRTTNPRMPSLSADPVYIDLNNQIKEWEGEVEYLQAQNPKRGDISDADVQQARIQVNELTAKRSEYLRNRATMAPAASAQPLTPKPLRGSVSPQPTVNTGQTGVPVTVTPTTPQQMTGSPPAPASTPQTQQAADSALQRAIQELGPGASREAIKARAKQLLTGG